MERTSISGAIVNTALQPIANFFLDKLQSIGFCLMSTLIGISEEANIVLAASAKNTIKCFFNEVINSLETYAKLPASSFAEQQIDLWLNSFSPLELAAQAQAMRCNEKPVLWRIAAFIKKRKAFNGIMYEIDLSLGLIDSDASAEYHISTVTICLNECKHVKQIL